MLSNGRPIRVLVADDHELVRLGLRSVLEEAGIDVVAEAADGLEAVERALESRPDILLLDLRMPGMGGVDVCRRVRAEAPEVNVVVLTSFAEDDDIFGALSAGASSYLSKDVTADALVGAIKGAAGGQTVLGSGIAQRVIDGPHQPSAEDGEALSPRELEVLGLMAEGLTNRQIGARLWISEPTVKTHVSHILAKLEEPDRNQAVLHAARQGLIASPDQRRESSTPPLG